MQRIIVFLVCIFYGTPLLSQHFSLLTQATSWDAFRIDTVLYEKLNSVPNYKKERWIPLINFAKEHYDMTTVFQAEISNKDSEVEISIAENDFPLDLYYTGCRFDVKLIVLTYLGEIEIVDTAFTSMVTGLAKKEAKAFRYIIKQRPNLVFVCKDVFGCFFYVKNNVIYVYDYYHQEKSSLYEYSRLSELF